jgi:hypothetical protein
MPRKLYGQKLEHYLRRIQRLLKLAKEIGIVKACRKEGFAPNTYQRYKKLYASGGEEAARVSLTRKHPGGGGRPRKSVRP